MPPKYDRLNEFMASLITGMKPTNRPGFIGSERAKQIA